MPSLKSRFRPLALGAGALFVFSLAAAPAVAQYYPVPRAYPPAPPPPQAALAPYHADAVVRSLGLTPLGPAIRRGPVFVVPAVGQEGTQVQVTLDRRSGRVMQITRLGPSAPRMAAFPPGRYGIDDDDDEYGYFEDDDELPPLVRGQPLPRDYSRSGSGPAVITREGIHAQDLPPPGAGPRVIERDPDITGSVPRRAERGPVDPLLGVPKEFRGRQAQPAQSSQQRTAARPPAATPRAAPLPRPRPADAPAVAQTGQPSPPAVQAAPVAEPAPEASDPAAAPKPGPDEAPPVQGFE
jgi:hypothetical protein